TDGRGRGRGRGTNSAERAAPTPDHGRRPEGEVSMEEYTTFPMPFGSDILEKIEAAAVAAARELLTGRRILEVEGPYGLGLTTVEVGDDELCRQPGPDEASAVMSRAVSVPMIYRRFALSKRRIAAVEDMHQPLTLKVVADAAQAREQRAEALRSHGLLE